MCWQLQLQKIKFKSKLATIQDITCSKNNFQDAFHRLEEQDLETIAAEHHQNRLEEQDKFWRLLQQNIIHALATLAVLVVDVD